MILFIRVETLPLNRLIAGLVKSVIIMLLCLEYIYTFIAAIAFRFLPVCNEYKLEITCPY